MDLVTFAGVGLKKVSPSEYYLGVINSVKKFSFLSLKTVGYCIFILFLELFT